MPVKYVPYFPNTIEGQAVLNNITRTRRLLQYRDNGRVYERLRRGMPLYEVETIETVGEPSDNLLIRGECIAACAYLKDKGITVDLVYIDPPFASGADYAKNVYLRRNPKIAEQIDKAEQSIIEEANEESNLNGEPIDLESLRSFEEKMYGDVWNKEDYLNWMYENLVAIKSVMSEDATIYMHLDWHIGHYVKVLMDEVFGEESFTNEIIWQKIRVVKAQSESFGNVHDAIYRYSKSQVPFFVNQTTEQNAEYAKKFYRTDPVSGRRYQPVSLRQAGAGPPRRFGDKVLDPGAGRHWIWSQARIDLAMQSGDIELTKTGIPRKRQFIDESEGRIVDDLWTDIFPLNSQAAEDTGYDTQKPEKLLERIINASSQAGMVVCDFFGGSGTTAKKANDLGRKFISVEVGINGIQIARDRLVSVSSNFSLLDVKDGVSLYRNPVQTMDKLMTLIPGLQANGDLGSKIWAGSIQETKGTIVVYLPNLLESTSRVLDEPEINRILNEAMPDLPDEVKKVAIYYIDIDGRAALDKFIKEQNSTAVDVELRDLKQILDDVVLNDIIEYDLKKVKGGYELELTRLVSDRLQQEIDKYNQKRGLPLFETIEEDDEQESETPKKKKFTPIEISDNGLELVELISLDCSNDSGPWKSDSEIKINKKGFVIRDGKQTRDFWDAKISSKKKPLRLKVRNIAGDETIVSLA